MTFEIKGIRWEVITNHDGTKKAIPTCADHPAQEAIVEGIGPHGTGVVVSCPECQSKLEFCSKEEFKAQKKNAEAS
jgi:hypothetical protein